MPRAFVVFALLCALPAAALAEEAALAEARTALDGAEKDIESLKAGDVASANAIIVRINEAVAKLNGCKERTEDWKAQGKRAKDLDTKARNLAAGKAPAGPVEPDETTVQAKADLDAIAKDVEALGAGDTDGANALVKRLNGVRDLLGKSSRDKRNAQLWKDCAARANALDKDVRARAAASSEWPDLGKLGRDDKYAFTSQFQPVYEDSAAQLAAGTARALASEWRQKRFADAIARMRAALGKIGDRENAAVKKAATKVDELEATWKSKVEEGKRLLEKDAAEAEAAAQDVDARLAAIEKFFDPRTFSCGLDAPYTAPRVLEWAAKLKEYRALQKKGLEMLEKIAQDHPEHAKNPRLGRLKAFFSAELERRLERDIELVAGSEAAGTRGGQRGQMRNELEGASFLLKADALTPERLANDAWATDAAAKARTASATAEAVAAFSKEWLGKDDPDATKLAADFAAAASKIEAGAAQTVAAARMPAARSTDEALLATAKEVLSDPAVGAGESRRTVVNAALKSHEERKSEARLDGDYIRVWTWTEVWDDYQVCCAEKVGADWRLVYYSLKFVHSGPKWMKLQKWYVRERIVSQRILEENIGK